MKKFTSLLLAAALLAAVMTAFAVTAFAEDTSKPESAAWLADEGENHVWWELTENGTELPDGGTGLTLIIGGKGEMPDYDDYDDRPWADDAEAVTAVEIASGVTKIGEFAFFYCSNLTSVTIPLGVTGIGNGAFTICSNLTSITIPSGVTSIGDSAFQDCSSLTSISIPTGVTSIGKSAFAYCTNLTSITIPSGVTSIGSNAFTNCSNLASVTIPSGVTSIGSDTFQDCTSLKSVTIPSGVTSIDSNAFTNCSNLASVTIPSSVTSIGTYVFQYCTSLSSITFKAKTPPTCTNPVSIFPSGNGLVIYIPDGTSDGYKLASRAWTSLISKKIIQEAYVVDDKPTENGTVTVDKDCFPTETYTAPNQTVTVTVMPAEGYRLKEDSLSVVAENGTSIALTQDKTDPAKYTFMMPKANVTVKAEFEKIPNADNTGSTISGGNVWIIVAIALTVILLEVLVYLSKRNKKKNA